MRRIWTWLGTTANDPTQAAATNAQRVQALAAVVQALGVVAGLAVAVYTLHYYTTTLAYNAQTLETTLTNFAETVDHNARSLDESNRLAWRTSLDNKSAELGRLLFTNKVLHCAYKYRVALVDDDCLKSVYQKENLSQLLNMYCNGYCTLRKLRYTHL